MEPPVELPPYGIPAGIALFVPGVKWLSVIRTDSEPGPQSAAALMNFAVKAAGGRGAVTSGDPRSAVFAAPEDIVFAGGRSQVPACGEFTRKLFLSLWFVPGVRPDAGKVAEILREVMPFALPERYGTSEPPEYTYAGNGGFEGFRDFFAGCSGFPVFYCRMPVTHLFASFPAAGARDADGNVRAGYITLEAVDSVFDRPEWREALTRLLRRLSAVTGAFFGQIVRGGRQVAGGSWKGIPMVLGEACVIGGDYYRLIPGCSSAARCGDTPDGFADDGSSSAPAAYFEEPDGPTVDTRLISRRKKNIFGSERGRGRGYVVAGDFTSAAENPVSAAADAAVKSAVKSAGASDGSRPESGS